MPDRDSVSHAFNLGSDARIGGIPLTHNPYTGGTEASRCWIKGWRDADAHWGEESRRARILPKVAGGCRRG